MRINILLLRGEIMMEGMEIKLVKNKSIDENRIGQIIMTADFITHHEKEYHMIMSGFIITRAEMIFRNYGHMIEYIGYHEKLPQLREGEMIPTYEITFAIEEGGMVQVTATHPDTNEIFILWDINS